MTFLLIPALPPLPRPKLFHGFSPECTRPKLYPAPTIQSRSAARRAATDLVSKSFQLASSKARVTSVKSTKQESVDQLVSSDKVNQWSDMGPTKMSKDWKDYWILSIKIGLDSTQQKTAIGMTKSFRKKFQRSIYGCYMKMLVLITIDFLWPGRSVDLGKAGERVCLQRAKSFWRRQ